jgi:hypothetical protein
MTSLRATRLIAPNMIPESKKTLAKPRLLHYPTGVWMLEKLADDLKEDVEFGTISAGHAMGRYTKMATEQPLFNTVEEGLKQLEDTKEFLFSFENLSASDEIHRQVCLEQVEDLERYWVSRIG